MNIGSAAVLIYLFVLMIKKEDEKQKFFELLFVTAGFSLAITTGYFCVIQGYELLYDEFLVLVLAGLSVKIIWKYGIHKRTFYIVLFFLICVCLGQILLALFPAKQAIIDYSVSWDKYLLGACSKVYPSFSMRSVLMLLRVVLFSIVVLAASRIQNASYWIKMFYSTLTFSKFIIIYGFIELFFKSINVNLVVFLVNPILGTSKGSVNSIIMRGDGSALQGFTREPSHFAHCLFVLGICIIIGYFKGKIKKTWLVLDIVLLMLTMSFTGLIGAFFLYLIYFLGCVFGQISEKRRVYSFIIELAVVVGLVFISVKILSGEVSSSYYFNRLNNVVRCLEYAILNKGTFDYSSEAIRIIGVIDTIKSVIVSRALLGFGIGTAFAYGALPCIISNIGVLGVWMWIKMLGEINVGKMRAYNRILCVIVACFFMFSASLEVLYAPYMILLVAFCNFLEKENVQI